MRPIDLRLSPERQELRRQHIGGSDAKIIVTGNDESVVRLWREKRGEIEPEDLSRNLAVAMGSYTEPLNVHWFQQETGLDVTRCGEHAVSAERSFMACSLDGFISEEAALLECKHSSGFEDMETLVSRYFPQVQHGMRVIGAKHCYLSVFLGTARWACEKIVADPFYQDAIIEAEAAFWDCVLSGEPPRQIALETPKIALSDMRIVDMSGSNSWANHAADWLENRAASVVFNNASEGIKELVEKDVKEATGGGISATRDKRGAIRIKAL